MSNMQITTWLRWEPSDYLPFFRIRQTECEACCGFVRPRFGSFGLGETGQCGLCGFEAFEVGEPAEEMRMLVIFEQTDDFDVA